jgi:polyhydroxyalkanoate synthesis regulator phasin
VSPDTLKFVLQVVAIALGGGCVQLIIFFLRRRSELRQLDTSSDVNVSTASATLIARLQEDGAVYREQVKLMQDRIDTIEKQHEQAQRSFNQQLMDAHSENIRLTTRIAQLNTDLDITTRQVNELRERLGRF